MTNLDKALGDIRSIRRQMARSTEFRGYGPLTLAATGVCAVAAAGVQARWVAQPEAHAWAYFTLWMLTAVVSLTAITVQAVTRTQRMHSGMADEMIRLAAEQFLPAAIAGVLVSVVLLKAAPSQAWMLPGLWQVVYALGVFSSSRFLPRATLAVGAWYLFTGLLCLSLGDARALSPWSMGGAYVVGQLMIAAIVWANAKELVDEV